jgi:hypothetical protein
MVSISCSKEPTPQSQGHPVECFLPPGSSSDGRALRSFQVDVPEGSVIYADKAVND